MLRLPAVYNDEEGIVQTPPMKFKTLAIHSGHNPLDHHGAVMTPIYQTSTFAFRGVNRPGAFEYSRSGNPTRKALETCLASLEGGAFGFAFATGMAAETTVVMMLEAGNRIIVHSDLYGGTFRLFEKVFRNKGIEAVYVDLRDLAETERELARGAAAVWIESPNNPLMNLVDLRALGGLTHRFRSGLRGPSRPGRNGARTGARRRCRMDRIADQPADESGGPARDGGFDASLRGDRHLRQHFPFAILSAAARTGRRHRRAFDDEVHQRPFGRGWRRRHYQPRGAGGEDRLSTERDRFLCRTAGQLPLGFSLQHST